MSTPVFDTHAFVKNLTEAGMPEKQAEALAYEQVQLLVNHLATKGDIDNLNHRIDLLESKFDARFGQVDAQMAIFREEMRSMEARLVARLGAIVALTGAAMAAFMKLA